MTEKSRMKVLSERLAKEQKTPSQTKTLQSQKTEEKETPEMRERRRIALQKLRTFLKD